MLKDGDTFNNATLATEANSAQARLGSLQTGDVARGALNSDQVPELWDQVSAFPAGLTKGYVNNIGYLEYDNCWPGTAAPYSVQAISTAGAMPPYGPIAADATGWRIPASSNTTGADPAELQYKLSGGTLASENLSGVLLRGSVEIGGTEEVVEGADDNYDLFHAAVGFEDDVGDRYIIEDSIRPYRKFSACRGSCSTGSYVTQADIDALTGDTDSVVVAFFLAVCSRQAGATSDSPRSIWVGSYWISALPVRAGSL